MEIYKKIIQNTAWLYFSEFVIKVMMFFFMVYLARKVGDAQFGAFNFAFSFTFLFMGLINFGMPTLLIRDCSLDKTKMSSYMSNILVFKVVISILVVIVTVPLSYILGYPFSTIKMVFVFSLYLVVTTLAQLFFSAVRVYEIMKYEAFIKIIEKSVVAIVGTLVLLIGFNIFEISLVYLLSGIVSLILIIYFFLKKTPPFNFSFDKTLLFSLVKRSLPFILIAVFYDIYLKIDITILSLLKGDAVTGWYSASTKLVELFIMVPIIFNRALLPTLTGMFNDSVHCISPLYNKISKYLFVISLPVFSLILVLDKKLIKLLYGEQYLSAAFSLVVLALTLTFLFQSFLNNYFLISMKKEKISVIIMGSLIILNAVLNFLVVPKYSLNGAAATTLICNFMFTVVTYFMIKRSFKTIMLKPFIFKILSLNILLIFFIYYLNHLTNNLFLILPLSACFYIIGVLILRVISLEEIMVLLNCLTGKKFFPNNN